MIQKLTRRLLKSISSLTPFYAELPTRLPDLFRVLTQQVSNSSQVPNGNGSSGSGSLDKYSATQLMTASKDYVKLLSEIVIEISQAMASRQKEFEGKIRHLEAEAQVRCLTSSLLLSSVDLTPSSPLLDSEDGVAYNSQETNEERIEFVSFKSIGSLLCLCCS